MNTFNSFWLILTVVTLLIFSLVLRPWQQKGATKWWVLFLGTITLLPLTLYHHWGADQQLAQAKHLQKELATTKQQLLSLGTRAKVVSELEKRVKANPKKAKGWYLLSKLYLGSGDHTKALQAIKTARKLEPNNPQYQLELAEVHFITHHSLSKSDRKLLTIVLNKQPANINALNLFALDAYQKNQHPLAITYWQKILTQLPADSKDAIHIRDMINKAKNHQI